MVPGKNSQTASGDRKCFVKAKLGADAIAETSLNFGYSFAGSVGMVFTMPSQFAKLFDDSDLDQAMKAIVRMAKLHTSDEFRSATVAPARRRASIPSFGSSSTPMAARIRRRCLALGTGAY